MLANRFDIGARGGPAFSVALCHLIQAKALLAFPIEIFVGAQLKLARRFDEGVAYGSGRALVRDKKRPVLAMIGVRAALVGFGFAEIGQDVVI